MAAEIVITGAEIATCLGLSRAQTWSAVVAGRCGIGPLTALEPSAAVPMSGGQAAELPVDFARELPREVRYLKWTIEHALAEAGALTSLPCDAGRCGFMLGTTLHGMRQAGTFLRSGDHEPLRHFLAGGTLDAAVSDLLPAGFAATTCSACSSSLGSIALGATMLQSGEFDLVVCGGYDTISEYACGGFSALRLVAPGALRPFARDRQGMKLGEGYGIIVLEREGDAGARGAKALARIVGWGESADAHHLTQPHPEGDGAGRAIAMALRMAGIAPAAIGLIDAHATGTPDNDAAEYAALFRVFGEHLWQVPVAAFKSHLGHTLGGAGAVELILAMMALREGIVPPCANASADEVEFPRLRLSAGSAKPARIGATLSISLGFGGANTAVVLTPHADSSAAGVQSSDGERRREAFITGIGVLVPGAVGNAAFLELIDCGDARAWEGGGQTIPEEQYLSLLNARRVRRMSEQVKLMLAAAALAMGDGGISDIGAFAGDCGAILASQHGSAHYSMAYYSEIVKAGLAAANPMLFAEGVPNACSAHLSLMLGVRGACQTIIGTRTAGLDALRLAAMRIAAGSWDRAIVGAAEEHCATIDAAYRHFGLCAAARGCAPFSAEAGFVTGSAAVVFVLESGRSMRDRGGRARGRILRGASRRFNGRDSIRACREVLGELGAPRSIITSANGTWIDRAELWAIRERIDGASVSSIYGHAPEAFAAMPLLGLAAGMLSRKMIPLGREKGSPPVEVVPSDGDGHLQSLAALCTEYRGVVSGIDISLE